MKSAEIERERERDVVTVLFGSYTIGHGLCTCDHAAGFFGDGDEHIVDLLQV